MTNLLIRKFIRSKGSVLGLLLLFTAGIISLHIGKIFLNSQANTVEKTAEFQKENLDRHLQHVDEDLGLLLYYIRFGLVNESPPLSGLAIGHRDIHPSVQSVNIRNLAEQKYSSELVNPFYQLLGNMDFSFVLIYLFPLIIISLCFNVLSEEKEGGTWKLILSQSENPIKIIRTKLWIRIASIFLIFFLLLLIGKIYLQIPFDKHLLAFALTSSCYFLFWFTLTWFVISLQKSSQQNAMILLFTWVSLTILVPASVNAILTNLYPVPEAYNTIIDSRDGYHNKWDEAKEPTINKFKSQYPQFAKYNHPVDESFSWFWYFAMQHMGDVEAEAATAAMKTKLHQKDKVSKTVGFLFPSMHTQFTMNSIGRSDLKNYLNFLNHLKKFHEEKRLYFYPKIFDQASTKSEQWDKIELEYYQDEREGNWFENLFPLIFWSLVLYLWAEFKMISRRILGVLEMENNKWI
jgi:ABC-2 type transport system permease protein